VKRGAPAERVGRTEIENLRSESWRGRLQAAAPSQLGRPISVGWAIASLGALRNRNAMKLQTKFMLVLLSATLLAFTGTQLLQQALSNKALKHLADENLDLLKEREQMHAENIFQTADPVVQETISLGEMPKLDVLIRSFTNIAGILEYSIYDSSGVAAYSSSREVMKERKTLPGEVRSQVLSAPSKLRRRTSEAFEIYRPMMVTSKCLECHDDLKNGGIGGVALLRLSTAALAKSEQDWITAATNIQATNIRIACLSTIGVGVVFFALVYQTVKRLITVPLRNVITGMQRVAEELGGWSAEIASSSKILAEGASEQAASLEETSASLEELASMTKHNGENAQKTTDLAGQARSAGERGAVDMEAMSAAMEALKASSQDVSKIVKAIDEIAFQTNLLALNAAVEAARAGEAGMGFAVVADEVRSLAHRSAQAAKETAAKIEGAMVKTTEGVDLSGRVGQALDAIVTKVRQVDDLAAEVATASGEQAQGLAQINIAVAQMDKVTQSSAASAEQSAAAAQELKAQAATMTESVAGLLKLVGGNGHGGRLVTLMRDGPSNRTSPKALSIYNDEIQ